MDMEHLKKLGEVLAEITNWPAAEKLARLEAACQGDASLYDDACSILKGGGTQELQALLAIAPVEDDLIGTCFGVWRLERNIGQGGMGSMWLVKRDDGMFRMQAALKLVHRHYCTPHLLERFRRERQILADLRHPYIASLLDGGERDDRPFLVMEYIKGTTIDRYCEARRLPITARISLIQKICGAISYAHGKGVIHRDIKPGNLMITESGEPKLLDFGIAGLQSETTRMTLSGLAPMTPEYASPEQLRGREACVQSDIYALGLVLFQLVMGKRPRALNESPLTILKAHHHAHISGEIAAVLARALADDPEKRYPGMKHFAEDLEHLKASLLLQGNPVRPTNTPTYDILLWNHPDDRDDARILAEYLTSHEAMSTWFEAWHVPLGASPAKCMAPMLDTIRTALICLGPQGRAPWQQDAALSQAFTTHIASRQMRVLPVLLPGATYPTKQSELPPFLRNRTWTTFPQGLDASSLQHLMQAI